ncbi:SWIM zinc finger family protein [Acidianus sulfidivorans]|nr:SWIM zinc finger family protein [Acidianus sulfidivorans]
MENSRLLRKAKLAAEKGRIIKIEVENTGLSYFVFLSDNIRKHKDHILTQNACDCKFFIFHKIYLNKEYCYHILALNYALKSEKDITTVKVDFLTFKQIILEIYNNGKSLKLRKIIYS